MTDETIFAAAVAINDANQRKAYLDQACAGDPDLRQEVEQLLSAHDSDNPVDRPPAALAMTALHDANPLHESSAKPGDRIGPYKLLERIGQGGMGEVWVADQLEPIKRRVALKLIKAGMDSKAVLARFEAERQALALMDHPNIAKVFDADTTPDGRPFFAMELVKGTPITEFCDIRKMTPRERLELFVPVCQAIQHAHQKGIIHRDIKPSNVLVALHDETPVAKVIDFGLAKAFGQQLTEKTLYTAFGSLIGTPAYMAPEQATFNQLDIDTRADVYALGVLLYELLTGSPPVEPERLRKAALDEVLRIVRDEDPIRPSLRLSTSEARAKIANTRQSDPSKLSALMRGELDWIVMKALEKDRTRRYETATSLGQDVTRYLEGDAVEACPPTLRYRFGKLLRRNRPQVAAVALVLGALLVGIAGTTFGLIRAQNEREGALVALEEAKLATEKERTAREQAVDQRFRAERAIARTLEVLDSVTSKDSLQAITTQQKLSDEQKEFLNVVLEYYQELAREKGRDRETRARTAAAARRVGYIHLVLGNRKLASEMMGQARKELTALAEEFPENLEYRDSLARSWASLGSQRMREDESRGADEAFRKAERYFESLVEADPESVAYLTALGRVLNDRSVLSWYSFEQPEEARRMHQRSVSLLEQAAASDQDGQARLALGHAYYRYSTYEIPEDQGNLAEREAMALKSYQIREQLVAEYPDRREHLSAIGSSCRRLGELERQHGNLPEAARWYRKAVEYSRQYSTLFPSAPRAHDALAYSFSQLAQTLEAQKKWPEAETVYLDAMAIMERLEHENLQNAASKRNSRIYADRLCDVYYGLRNVLIANGQTGQDREIQELDIKRARLRVTIDEQFQLGEPTQAENQIRLASSTNQLADAILRPDSLDESIAGTTIERAKESLPWLDKAVGLLEPHVEQQPEGIRAAEQLARSYGLRGEAYSFLDDHSNAAEAFAKAAALSQDDRRSYFRLRQTLAQAHFRPVDEVIGEFEKRDDRASAKPFFGALVYAVASGRSERNAEAYALRAIELLEQALDSDRTLETDEVGERLNHAWQQDPDLASLRDRDDFKQLIARTANEGETE